MKEQRPLQILEAAFAVFKEHGYAAARVEDVAERVGVSKGTIYVYFPSKAELFKEVVRSILAPLMEHKFELTQTHSGSAEELLRMHLDFGYASILMDDTPREFMRLMIAEGARVPELVDFYVEEVMKWGVENLRGVLRHGIETGEFAPDVLERFPEPDVLIGPAVYMCVTQMLVGDRHGIDVEAWKRSHLDLILNGLKAR